MKQLLIMRHAKSDWEHEELSDFDRPLNSRGLENAPEMGKRLLEKQMVPDLILSSPAVRAKATAELIAKGMNYSKNIEFAPKFYMGSVDKAVQIIRKTDNSINRLMIVGHNPTWEHLAGALSVKKIILPMPTAAVVLLQSDCTSWNEIQFNSMNFVWQIKPKDN